MTDGAGRAGVMTGWLIAMLAAAAGPGAGRAPAQLPGASVSGRIVDSASGAAVAGAEVTLHGARMVTGASGEFRLGASLTGADTLRVRRLGFASKAVAIAGLPAGPLEVVIATLPQLLSPTVVYAVRPRYTGRLAGYYQRLERGTAGQFITRTELDNDKQGMLSNVLQHFPGVQVRRGRGGPVVSMRGRNCRPLVWLDGVALGAADVDIDAFAPSSLHGVELYLGSMSAPQRFQASHGKSECGTILLWSRGPDTDPVGRGLGATPAELEHLLRSSGVFTAAQVDVPALVDPRDVVVVYPQLLRATNTAGAVLVEFVVDTSGKMLESSFGVIAAPHPSFAEAVRVALLNATFRPATLRGRPVRQLVRQRFAFGATTPQDRRP